MNKKIAIAAFIFVMIQIMIGIFVPDYSVYLPEIILGIDLLLGSIWAFQMFGWKKSVFLIALSFVITIALENISIVTGFPYGVFQHTLPGPWIGNVPVVVGFAYFPFVTLGWIYGDLITRSIHTNDTAKRTIRILLAMLVVGAVEALYDPVGSLLLNRWDYTYGGGVFGVPMTNALGWMLNTGVTLLIFEIVANKTTYTSIAVDRYRTPIIWLLAIQPTSHLIARLVLPNTTVYDNTGKAWGQVDLFDTLGIFGIMMMGMLVLFGIITCLRDKEV